MQAHDARVAKVSGFRQVLAGLAATVAMLVSPAVWAAAPVAVNDAYTTAENGTLSPAAPGVLANDTGAAGSTLTAVKVTDPLQGTLVLNADGSFIYTPTLIHAFVTVTDSFTYMANDGALNSNVATVTITVTGLSMAPVAVADAYTVIRGGTLSPAAPGVLGNDTDELGTTLTAVALSNPSHGTLALGVDGAFTYTHDGSATGADSFTYKANDGALDSNVATVTITVTAPNQAPSAVHDAYTLGAGGTLVLAAPGVLGNDTDADGNTLTAIWLSHPAHGTLTLSANGSFTYVHDGSEAATDSFTYRANDGSLDSSPVTVTFTVAALAAAPVAVDDAYTVAENEILSPAAPGVLGNDTGAAVSTLTAVKVTDPLQGTLVLNAYGSFTYTPTLIHAFGVVHDSFTYMANDGALNSNVATVTITVTAANHAPSAVNDAYELAEGGTLSVVAPGVLANDTDAEGGTLTAVKVSDPLYGTLVLNASGAFTYTHDGSPSGSDSFTYRASDGLLFSNVTTVSITVSVLNQAPVAVDDAVATSEDTPTTIAVLDNDSDMDGDALAVTAVSNPAHGSAALNQDSTVRYAPDTNYSGSDTFFYTLSDGRGGTDTGTVTVTVGAVNDAPTAAPDAYGTPRNVTLNTPAPGVLANDGDLEGAPLTAVLVTGPAHGTLAFHANGSFTYVPAADYYGADSFTYQANDAALDSNLGTVYLSVRSLSGAPLAAADVYTSALNGTLAIAAPGVLANDSDVDGHVLSAVLVGGAAHGTVALSADGSFVYTPDAGWSGVDSFAYKASDGELDSIAATATLTVGVFAVGDGDMFLAKMTCSLNWARHAAGVAADTLTIAGVSNPRGCALDLTGASAVLRVNGVRLSPVMTLDARGSASRLSGSLTYSFRFDRKRGSYSLDLKGLDLRAVLGLSRPLATVLHESPVPVMLDLTIAGAGLEVPLVVGTFECPLATTAGKTSRLTFETRSDCTLTGVFQCCLAGASQKTGAVYSLATRGVIEAAGGGAVVPTGDITVTIGQATLVIPFAQVVDHGTAWSYAGTSPGITAFSLHNDTHNFALSASRVAGTGIPLSATDAPTAHGLYVQLRVPTAAGVMVFDSTVELLRPSGRQLTWRR